MKNQMCVCCLLLMLAFASCTKMEVGFKGQVYLYQSEPEVTRYSLEKRDSIVVKGFNNWAMRDEHKGMLPDNVVKDSGYDKSYYYCTYEATVEIKDDMDKLVFPKEKVDVGYSTIDFEGKGFMQVSDTKDGHKYVKLYTYLVHIFKDENGKEADIWYPHSPFELEWTFFSIDK